LTTKEELPLLALSPSTQIYNQLELMLYNYPTLELLVLFSLSNPNPTNTKYN
jgi:hypothetical protein